MWMHADFHATQAFELSIVETNRPGDLLADDEGWLLTDVEDVWASNARAVTIVRIGITTESTPSRWLLGTPAGDRFLGLAYP